VKTLVVRSIAFSALLLVFRSPWPALAEITWADLHPAEALTSNAYGVSGSHEAGSVRYASGALNAALWSGSASSFLNLNPDGAIASWCWGAGGEQQVGDAAFWFGEKTITHAALWTGTADSFVDLHPTWADSPTESTAVSTTGSEQSGYVRFEPGIPHYAKWYGSAANSVDLGTNQPTWNVSPPPGFSKVYIRAVTENYQAGVAVIDDSPPSPGAPRAYSNHAGLWHGTPVSFVDLHPVAATGSSDIYGAYGSIQVGMAVFGRAHAGLWSGTAESFVDLHAVLGAATFPLRPLRFGPTAQRHVSSARL
jgi:hypothetical protein